MKFRLDGCDIAFNAEAPEDITLKQLLEQCDRIVPDYCACGIRSLQENEYSNIDLKITYDDIQIVSKFPSCTIKPKKIAELEKTISWRDKPD